MEELIKKAGILIDALPYIQKFSGKTIIIKYGGNAMINEELKRSVIEDITLLKFVGLNPIVVHGGGPDISKALDKNGIKSKFVNGLRVTDKETMQIAQQVLVGKTNKEIVSLLNCEGAKAMGICGLDGGFIKCKKYEMVVDGEKVDIGFVGDIVSVDPHMIMSVANDGYIPVIAPIGMDDEGNSYNINADNVAAAVAIACEAEKLILLTDVEGVKDANGDIVYEAPGDVFKDMIADGTINGGMIPKVTGCLDAIEAGVKGVHIIDGRIPHCLLLEIFTKSGIGTLIKSSTY
ncbi:MAG: acetylglutamate kinase [Clostridia bacterium]|nr:acetylglutamate kinase [Clostridia bacterium]